MEAFKHKMSNIMGGKMKGKKRSYKHMPQLDQCPSTLENQEELSSVHEVSLIDNKSELEVDVSSNSSNENSNNLIKKLRKFRSVEDLLGDVKAVVMKSKKNSYSQLNSVADNDDCRSDPTRNDEIGINSRIGAGFLTTDMKEGHFGMDTSNSSGVDSDKINLLGKSTDFPDGKTSPVADLSPGCGSNSSDGEVSDNRMGSPGSEKCLPIHDGDLGVPIKFDCSSSGKDSSATCDDNIVDDSKDTKVPSTSSDSGVGVNAAGSETTIAEDLTAKDKDTARFKVPMMQKSHSTRRLSLTGSFELPRFRKRKHGNKENDDDNISVQSLDVSGNSIKKKSKKSLLRVSASLANLISPSRNKNDSEGFKVPNSPVRQVPTSPYRPPQPSPAKRPVQLTWQDSFGSGRKSNQTLSQADIKRQEAIYELYQGEKAIMDDLINVTKLYRDSLVTLNLLSPQDVHTLFGNIDSLVPVHKDLIQRLQDQRQADGTTQNIGAHVLEWVDSLTCYVAYCANQIAAKAIFDEIKNQSAVADFLQRCLASPFSRKLDLWTLLDGAKARFIKYPLLVRSIIKYTANDSEDAFLLEKAVKRLEEIIREADHETGLAKCNHSKSNLLYLFDEQKVPEIESSTALICSGCMKNTKGSKLYVFIFDKVVVVSRSTNQNGRQTYQVYRQPIPISDLVVEDLPDGEVKLGSFRNAFGQGGQTGKNLIRISFHDNEKGQAHTLIANDEHDKRQWVQSFQKVTNVLLHTTTSSSLSSSSSSSSSSSTSSADSKSKDKSSSHS